MVKMIDFSVFLPKNGLDAQIFNKTLPCACFKKVKAGNGQGKAQS